MRYKLVILVLLLSSVIMLTGCDEYLLTGKATSSPESKFLLTVSKRSHSLDVAEQYFKEATSEWSGEEGGWHRQRQIFRLLIAVYFQNQEILRRTEKGEGN